MFNKSKKDLEVVKIVFKSLINFHRSYSLYQSILIIYLIIILTKHLENESKLLPFYLINA
jgi:hypothetical protein